MNPRFGLQTSSPLLLHNDLFIIKLMDELFRTQLGPDYLDKIKLFPQVRQQLKHTQIQLQKLAGKINYIKNREERSQSEFNKKFKKEVRLGEARKFSKLNEDLKSSWRNYQQQKSHNHHELVKSIKQQRKEIRKLVQADSVDRKRRQGSRIKASSLVNAFSILSQRNDLLTLKTQKVQKVREDKERVKVNMTRFFQQRQAQVLKFRQKQQRIRSDQAHRESELLQRLSRREKELLDKVQDKRSPYRQFQQ